MTVSGGRVSEARARLLRTAGDIFYAEGIHSVGVERIVAGAKVTRATFYRHFPSKENLVVAYLRGVDDGIRKRVTAALGDGRSPAEVLRGIGLSVVAEIRAPGFRGCPFLNAVAEYPDPADPVHQTVIDHRQWFLGTVTQLLATIRDALAEGAGRFFVMLRDGAMAGGHLADPALAGETFMRGIEVLLTTHSLDARGKAAPTA